jgi:hypothetical protein
MGEIRIYLHTYYTRTIVDVECLNRQQIYRDLCSDSGCLPGISEYNPHRFGDRSILHFQRSSNGEICGDPRSAGYFHLVQLAAHGNQLTLRDTALLASIMSTEPNSHYAYSGSEPEASDTRFLPKSIALLSESFLIGVALIFLNYSINLADYFILLATIGGFLPFCLGFILIFFCFLPDPPPIFGFVIGP